MRATVLAILFCVPAIAAEGGRRPVSGRPTYLILKVDTTDLVDGKQYKPTGQFKVTGTEKHKGKTVFVLSQENKK